MSNALRQLVLRRPANSRSMSVAGQAGEHGEAAAKLWANLTKFVAMPLIGIASFIVLKDEFSHPHPRPEFRPYEHLRIRKKNFPWGNGKKSFFHNPHTNALPTGYEDEH